MSSIGFWLRRARAAARRPPKDLAIRAAAELGAELERFRAGRRQARFDEAALLAATGAPSVDALWHELATRPFVARSAEVTAPALERLCPEEPARIEAAAARVLTRTVDLLGSGPAELGTPIDWHRDFKSGTRWAPGYGRRIEYNQLDRPSDVKVPWELSRLQWAIPAGQAYVLTRDERYAAAVRSILDEWLAANPYAWSVNWAVTMEVALRIVTWAWLFSVFSGSEAWSEPSFRSRFLRALYLHCDYTERNLERSEINGNHFTADAAGLAIGGLYFGDRPAARRWAASGWALLSREIERQVLDDGVDFEASTAYHRLVAELFFLPALYRERLGLPVEAPYRERLVAMARFALAYCRPDGTSPLAGDADDGRALPLGGQALGDHRYLAGLVGATWGVDELRRQCSGQRSEVAWLLGPEAATGLGEGGAAVPSRAFPTGGFYVLRGPRDHVFVDCGPVGFAGRGGHGHNDCLSFEAWLDGALVVTDSGSYVYTSDFRARNRFRATAAHNTPIVDDEEQNRFVRPEYLWLLRDDARPATLEWRPGDIDLFRGTHDGYRRLACGLAPVRTIALDRSRHLLAVLDEFESRGPARIVVPYHLAAGADVTASGPRAYRISTGGRAYAMSWSSPGEWRAELRPSLVSPSYGVARENRRIALSHEGTPEPLLVAFGPADGGDHLAAARALVARPR